MQGDILSTLLTNALNGTDTIDVFKKMTAALKSNPVVLCPVLRDQHLPQLRVIADSDEYSEDVVQETLRQIRHPTHPYSHSCTKVAVYAINGIATHLKGSALPADPTHSPCAFLNGHIYIYIYMCVNK